MSGPSSAMLVSVVIITKNQRSFLEQTLPRITGQRGLLQPPEVIVVDSGSTDGACAFALQQGARLICLKPHEFGYAHAHNAGAAVATGEIVVRLSGDAIPANRDWLSSLVAPFADASVACTWGGQSLPAGLHSAWERWSQHLLHKEPRDAAPVRIMGRARTILGSNMAVRRRLWKAHPYDERLAQAEDYAWAHHWLKTGAWAGVFVPGAVVVHGHDEPLFPAMRRSLTQSALQGLILAGLIGRGAPPRPDPPLVSLTRT
ncbi:MAG: glycosyltransferase [Cytophagales bacterium]|nr:glycosyltransferase [Armatimonadota bacterium]